MWAETARCTQILREASINPLILLLSTYKYGEGRRALWRDVAFIYYPRQRSKLTSTSFPFELQLESQIHPLGSGLSSQGPPRPEDEVTTCSTADCCIMVVRWAVFYSGTKIRNDSTDELRRESGIKWSAEPKRRPHTYSRVCSSRRKSLLRGLHVKLVTSTHVTRMRACQVNPTQGQDPKALCKSQREMRERAALSHSSWAILSAMTSSSFALKQHRWVASTYVTIGR